MHPSSRPSVPPRSRRFDNRHIGAKPSHVTKREDKNMNTASPRRVTRGPPESSRLKGPSQGARAPVVQAKLVRPQRIGAHAIPAISKPKSGRSVLHPAPAVDPNCNEPSLPCLCCDGHSPQDNNSLFNHNHNNNNTVNIRQQMKLPPPPPPNNDKLAVLKQDVKEDECQLEVKQPHVVPVEEKDEVNGNMDEKDADHLKNGDDGVNENGNVDVNGNGGNDDEDDDDDTLVPSCGNCPDSMLDFSLTSSTSSSSTSISSCSDLECDCPDTFSLSSHDQEDPEHYQSSHSPATHCPSFESSVLPMDNNPSTRTPISPCSIDEGYPSAPSSPCSDYMDRKGGKGTCIKVNLLNFLDSMEELGKVDLFYRIVKLAHWELDNELIVRDRLDHQQKLQRVNKEVKLAYLLKLQEEGLDFNNEDIPRVLDEMGNIDISWKLYKSNKSCDSQEFSDGGVDLTATSDLDETPVTEALSPSPKDLLPPPRPPKPPKRHASTQPESHKYQNISGHVFSVSSTDETTASSTAVSAPTLPKLSSLPSTVKPPAISPPPSQPVPYFTLNTDSSTHTSPTPPIPPPRRRHKARLEAQRLAELEREKTPHTLPPPTSRPPPLPPPPASTTVIPPPPSVPPPPSFHVLDVEIRKLLALAGLTQAELLKLSPELGVCVDVVSANETISEMSQMEELRVNTTKKEDSVNEEMDSRLKDKTSSVNFELDVISEKEVLKAEHNDTNRITSFTEMARRRKRNGVNCNHGCGCSYGHNVTLSPNSYYSAGLKNQDIPDVSIGRFENTSIISDTPPPPPPRPLPPCPALASNSSEVHSLKSSTLPANATRPDRFDWLIAFTPDTESPPLEMRKVSDDGMIHKTNSGSKVTTFKELRNRSKQSSLPAPALPEPDPNVVTPDPDFLYNLKWRREKIEGDGWEYTSQAQASFLQPPPTPASLSLFREMCHLNIQDNCPAEPKVFQQIGCSVSEGSLRTICGERYKENKPKKLEDGEKMEVRGMADGAWTLESRTTGEPPRLSPVGAISPPLRPGPPIPGTDVPHLYSPLFPRSHTLPALAAPLYYPYLYTPPVQAPLREPSVSILHSQQTPPPHTLTVRSFSFAGSEQKNAASMGDDARPSVKTEGLSSACLQEKRTLVSAVSLAVEAILAQFNSSRTLVQKALSGDSRVNPTLGRLVLQCLCPALRSLLCDGLKPHQSDLIAGRRPNSPWALVQASTKPGPSTQALHNLQAKVAGLPQLKHSRHRFNAFLFGLLNNKLLDHWLSHLHSCCDVLETFYRPMSFMRLSLTSCKPLFEELVILLQPLSLLTFNLDLLFQHHHLDHASPTLTPASHSSDIRSPPNENFSFYLSPKGLFQGSDHHLVRVLKQDHGSLNPKAGLTSLSSHALDMFEESTCRNPFLGANKDEASSPLSWLKGNDVSGILASGGSGASLSQQAGQALQQGWGAVMRLGERLGQNFGLASSSSSEDVKGPLDNQKTGFLLHQKSPVENRQQPREDLSLWDRETAVPWNLGRLFGASKSPNNPPTSRRPSQWLSPGASVLTRIVNLGQDSPSENSELQRNTDKEKDENQTSKETRDQPMPLRVVRTLCDYTGTRGELSFRKGEELVLLGDVYHDWMKCLQGDKEGLVPIGYASLVM
ncbi:RUN and SH3 domain-containing protein 1 [Triplophysa tibetana]|uniref:RUN and SH3 domain-containing protein 1 n=1 Tax=Triplophysa tibetana TaxID=1572043 RepID=A0A5A9N3I8_9TELE|nr:RUN and SH3 domain-containing protein 1 [Triplophysa tibetana]